MQQSDFKRFNALMNGMAKLYERELDKAVLDAYWLALGDWTLEAFEAAAAQLMRTSKFMPRPADFHELRKAGRLTAGEAWARVLEYVRKAYSRWDGGGISKFGNTPEPDSVLIDRAVKAIGGYEAIAMSRTDQTPFLEKRFCEHYESIQDATEIREAVPQIAFDERPKIASGPRKLLS
jgi:hypothetical protein